MKALPTDMHRTTCALSAHPAADALCRYPVEDKKR